MRATILTSCAVLALSVTLGSRPGLAQGAGADKPVAAPAGAVAPSPGRPVAPQPAGETASPGRGAGRVGSLSPDEERRAARGRERAATAAKAAQGRSERTQPEPVHAERTQAEPVHVKPVHAERAQPERLRAERAGAAQPAAPQGAEPAGRAAAEGPAVRKPRQAQARTIRSARAEPAPRRSEGPLRRRRLAGDPGRAPRVGDTVPDDVPLGRLPPGVRPGLIGYGRILATAPVPRGPLFFRPYLPAYAPYPVYPYPASPYAAYRYAAPTPLLP